MARHIRTPLEKLPPPERRFGHLHVDLVGPLPQSEGCSYLFTMVDRWSRLPEAVPLTDITTVNCANTLIRGWVARFGVPNNLIRPRDAIHVVSVGGDEQDAGDKMHHNNGVPPAGKRVS